jgi:cysteine desulfurase
MSHLYFNNAFSKRPMEESVAAMSAYLQAEFENPLTESEGAEKVRQAILRSRTTIAEIIHAKPSEIVFVSSGTEANNWALKGAIRKQRKNHVVISAVEHFSVYQTAEFLRREGVELSIVPVNKEGIADPHAVAEAITPTTVLVSVQCASDETGVIQDFAAISGLKSRFPDVLFHTDAIQFVCYEDLDVVHNPFDLVSLSANAIYGPSGVGALYIRERTRLMPMLHGGMQEEGMRPGLQSTALIAGFGVAAEVNQKNKEDWRKKIRALQQKMIGDFRTLGLALTGSISCRSVDNVHVIADVDGEALLTLLMEQGVRASSGSTCYQYAQKESHVLKAMGISSEKAQGSLLFTLDKDHTEEDINSVVLHVANALAHLRHLKPY